MTFHSVYQGIIQTHKLTLIGMYNASILILIRWRSEPSMTVRIMKNSREICLRMLDLMCQAIQCQFYHRYLSNEDLITSWKPKAILLCLNKNSYRNCKIIDLKLDRIKRNKINRMKIRIIKICRKKANNSKVNRTKLKNKI